MSNFIVKAIEVPNLKVLDGLAAKIAAKIKGGETLELLSDLGGGKTAFVRCLARHLKSIDTVASPSFTIENVYRCPRFSIHHFDFYRLQAPGICAFELQEALDDPAGLVIIEWSLIVADLLPVERLIVEIEIRPEGQDYERRRFVFKAPPSLRYLIDVL